MEKEKNIYEDIATSNPLNFINEDLSFDAIVQNPVLKPIAEINQSIKDLEEMNNKRLIDAGRELRWLVETQEEIPAYAESIFVARLWKLQNITGDVIKSYDIEIRALKKAMKEQLELIRQKYGLFVAEKKVIDIDFNPEDYLNKLTLNKEIEISETAKKIYEIYLKRDDKDIVKRFEGACAEFYQASKGNKGIQLLAAKISKREIKGGE